MKALVTVSNTLKDNLKQNIREAINRKTIELTQKQQESLFALIDATVDAVWMNSYKSISLSVDVAVKEATQASSKS